MRPWPPPGYAGPRGENAPPGAIPINTARVYGPVRSLSKAWGAEAREGRFALLASAVMIAVLVGVDWLFGRRVKARVAFYKIES